MKLVTVTFVFLFSLFGLASAQPKTFRLLSQDSFDHICELSFEKAGVTGEKFDYTSLGIRPAAYLGRTEHPNLSIVTCLGMANHDIIAGAEVGEDNHGNPMIVIFLNPEYMKYLAKKMPEADTSWHLNAIFAHEVAHLQSATRSRCAKVDRILDITDEDAVPCEHSADALAAEWVGKDQMVRTLRVINGYIEKDSLEKGWDIGRDNPYTASLQARIRLMKKAQISTDAR